MGCPGSPKRIVEKMRQPVLRGVASVGSAGGCDGRIACVRRGVRRVGKRAGAHRASPLSYLPALSYGGPRATSRRSQTEKRGQEEGQGKTGGDGPSTATGISSIAEVDEQLFPICISDASTN